MVWWSGVGCEGRAEEGLVFSLLCTFLHPTNASPKVFELPWGFYSCSSALVASKTFGRLVRSCLLYLKSVTKAVEVQSCCSDRCEGNISEGL